MSNHSVRKILFNATPTEKRAALLENDKVIELVIERPDSFRLVGNVYRGKIVSILPGIQAAFVDIGLEQAAFLHASDVDPSLILDDGDELLERYTDAKAKRRFIPKISIDKILTVGQQILVQVEKEPIGTKGARVTTEISLAGRFLVLVPDSDSIGVSKKSSDEKKRRHLKKLIAELKPKGVGIIVRTIGLKVSETEFVKEMNSLTEAWKRVHESALEGSGPKLVHREHGITTSVIRDLFSEDISQVIVDGQEDYDEILKYLSTVSPELCDRVVHHTEKTLLFDKYNIEKDLERSLRRKVWLKSGGYILFDHAEALMAIDVNSGRNVGRTNLEETIFRTNQEAAAEICRQFRLRDIGGIIVIDFIDMDQAGHRHQIEEFMHQTLAKDPSATSMTNLSKFGLMEITRKRVRPELRELYTDVCSACNGLGWVFSPATVSTRIDRGLQRAELQGAARELTIAVHPSVAAYLRRENGATIQKLEQEHAVKLHIREDADIDQDEYEFYIKGEKAPVQLRHQQ